MRTVSVAITLALLAVACESESSPEEMEAEEMAASAAMTDSARAAIEAANAKATAALAAGDVATWTQVYADDAILMQPDEPAWRGRADATAKATAMLQAVTITNPKFTTLDVMVSGDIAVETGAYSWTMGPKGGKAVDAVGKYLTVWKRQADGSWKIIRDINNSDGPAAR